MQNPKYPKTCSAKRSEVGTVRRSEAKPELFGETKRSRNCSAKRSKAESRAFLAACPDLASSGWLQGLLREKVDYTTTIFYNLLLS
jgi:hypothetical protein